MLLFDKKLPFLAAGFVYSLFLIAVMAIPFPAHAQTNDGIFPPQAQVQNNQLETSTVVISAAEAETAPEYQLPPGEDTHPLVRLTPDKSELIRLDTPAKSIIVGNPAHLSVLMENTRTLVLVPRDPGATSLMVLGENGRVIMQRHVIVASPKEKYVRIRRSCAAVPGGADCPETSVYYCPGMCHPVAILGSESGGAEMGTNVSAGGASGGNLSEQNIQQLQGATANGQEQ